VTVARILFLYSSVYGQSRKICERMRTRLVALGHVADVQPIGEQGEDPADFDAIVIGASIRHGKHNPEVLEFIHRHRALLESKVGAFFSVNLVARKPAKSTAETNPYARAFLARSPWKPQLAGVFGGVLDYQRYGLFDRYVIRLIMTINKGPTDLRSAHEFTDWDEVDRFAGRIAGLVAGLRT
jgi:menaquinone-dependent protoporphyrinogen oxidase